MVKSITLDVNHKCFDVNFKLDTGAEGNILPLYILNMFKVKPKLSVTNLSLTTYGNFKSKPDGSFIINCSTNKLKNVPLPFYVVNVKSKPILGLKGCKELKLIERIDAIEYNSVPVIHLPRRVPQALQPKLKSTLNNLEKEGIVSKVNKPTDWVQSLVMIEKPNGNLRLCLDPRDLNKVIKREQYQIPCTDDIISRLEGYDEDSHDAIMSKVLERARSLNIKFNPDKLQYMVSELKYVGQIISKSEFNWGKEQELSFVSIKELLAKAPILKLFSANDEIIIQCDSSKDGLGSCLIQKGQPASFVSRSLTNSEKNYAQIEKELLAIVFSFEKYHNFVYGRKVAIQSDHKPLMAIVKKPMHKISSRMQRMILKLLK
ncbi:transposon Tf2-9 polyprotein [Nephila pilipes]|uniref:Transposon Tf2-9 polyprotein n=1 Tax=Nephila pilipes TaxID=299642 RepID=A0A8X6IG22_NEPPI|nr:transposon Tf2-9 polyprotein [Nephila pilipes]